MDNFFHRGIPAAAFKKRYQENVVRIEGEIKEISPGLESNEARVRVETAKRLGWLIENSLLTNDTNIINMSFRITKFYHIFTNLVKGLLQALNQDEDAAVRATAADSLVECSMILDRAKDLLLLPEPTYFPFPATIIPPSPGEYALPIRPSVLTDGMSRQRGEIVAALATALNDRDGSVRARAARALGKIGFYEDLWPQVAQAEGKIGSQALDTSVLVKAVTDDKLPLVRIWAFEALWTCKRHALLRLEPAAQALVATIKGESLLADDSLGDAGSERSVKALQRGLQDPDESVQVANREVLEKDPWLRKVLEKDPWLRRSLSTVAPASNNK